MRHINSRLMLAILAWTSQWLIANARPVDGVAYDAKRKLSIYKQIEEKHLKNIRCRSQVFAALLGEGIPLESFKSLRQWTVQAPHATDGSTTVMSPTNRVGQWTEIQVFLNQEAVVRIISVDRTLEVNFALNYRDPSLDTCEPRLKSKSSLRPFTKDKNALTDEDLLKLVKEHDSGVLYLWSPNMPYSYDSKAPMNGIPLIKEAIKILAKDYGLDLHLTIAADPTAQRELIDATIKSEKSLTKEMGRSAQSMEVLRRSMNQHYPSILVYSKGRIARSIYPGVETAQQYAKVIRSFLLDVSLDLTETFKGKEVTK